MNEAHFHLILTHLPIMGTLVGLLLLTYALARRSDEVMKISLGVFVLSALAAGAVYLSGEGAEEAIEGLPGISEALIEQHEEAALVAVIATVVLGALALFGLLFFFRKRLPVGFASVALILALVVSGVMAWTANLGGQINHPEIRSGQVTAQTAGSQQSGAYDADDDD